MKQSPQEKRLEEVLRSSKIVAGGFLGKDNRRVSEIIEADTKTIAKLGCQISEVTEIMRQITIAATARLGGDVEIAGLVARVEEAKGPIVCPWPHSGNFAKRITYVTKKETQKSLRWTDLSIHMIAEHGFFEGKGSEFRIEPAELIEMIF